MGKRAKTRFVIRVAGIDREIFSVRDDSADGSLLILLRETPYVYGPGETRVWKVLEKRYSIHPSSETDGTTIKYSTLTEGRTSEQSSFINHSKPHLLWMMWASRQWHFENDNHLRSRSKDSIVSLGDLDQDNNTLLYTVWAWDNERPMANMPLPIYRVGARFRKFQVAVYFTVIPVPSIASGASFHIGTSETRIDKGPINHTHPDVESYPVDAISDITMQSFEMLRAAYMDELKGTFENQSDYDHFVERSFRFGVVYKP